MMSPSQFGDNTARLVYINGMRTRQAGAEQHAQLLQSAAEELVHLIYDPHNTIYDGMLAKLGFIDPPTQQLIDIVEHATAQHIPLIVSAQSLGTIKAHNAARAVLQRRYREWYERGSTVQEARAKAIAELGIVTWIFTGNAIWRLAPYLSGYLVYNIGDPVARAFGSRAGTERMQLITIWHNPTGKCGDEHRYVHHLPAVASLIRTRRSLQHPP